MLTVDTLALLSISNSSMIRMFADDICYYKAIYKDLDLVAVQSDVQLIADWVKDVRLKLNINKTKALVVSRKRQPPSLSLVVNDYPIEQVKSIRYLGVVITDNLSWSKQHA